MSDAAPEQAAANRSRRVMGTVPSSPLFGKSLAVLRHVLIDIRCATELPFLAGSTIAKCERRQAVSIGAVARIPHYRLRCRDKPSAMR